MHSCARTGESAGCRDWPAPSGGERRLPAWLTLPIWILASRIGSRLPLRPPTGSCLPCWPGRHRSRVESSRRTLTSTVQSCLSIKPLRASLGTRSVPLSSAAPADSPTTRARSKVSDTSSSEAELRVSHGCLRLPAQQLCRSRVACDRVLAPGQGESGRLECRAGRNGLAILSCHASSPQRRRTQRRMKSTHALVCK